MKLRVTKTKGGAAKAIGWQIVILLPANSMVMHGVRYFGLILVAVLLFSGCRTQRGRVFSNRDWHVSEYFGQLIDADTTWRVTFGERLIPAQLPVISCEDSLRRYPGMDRFLADILHSARLDSAEILFYAPNMLTMLVRPRGAMPPLRPSSVCSPLGDERPYTMWVSKDDIEDWRRTPDEMYTYTCLDKGKKRLIVVDFYDYGDEPVAQIFVFQSKNGMTERMGIPCLLNCPFFFKHDISKWERDVEFWAHIVDGHRQLAIANYKIGQEQLRRRLERDAAIRRADSLLAGYRYKEALRIYKGVSPRRMTAATVMNAAIAAAQCDEDSVALSYVKCALDVDSTYFDERVSVTELLEDCRLLPEWDALQEENERRLEKSMTGYDIPLRRQLLEIYHSDQDARGRWIAAHKGKTASQSELARLCAEMLSADSVNRVKVLRLLDAHRWIPRSKVGTANQALFFVVQHAGSDIIDRYMPIFECAANNGELPKDLFAKMYDRQQMYAGKPQRYGTQRVMDADTRQMVLWRLEDPDNVNLLRREMGLPPLGGYPQ